VTHPAEPAAKRAGVIGSASVHVLVLLGLVVIARGASAPLPLVYEVNLLAAPAPGEAPRRAAEAALPTRQDAEVAPADRTPERDPAPAPPPPPTPSRSEERPVPTRSEVTPLPGQTPSTGTDELTFRQEGLRFPYPEYLENIVTEVKRRWANPVGRGLRLRSKVAFTIQRDGTVTDISYLQKSGNFSFDTEAIGAIERAARDRAFGALPEGFNGESLPIAFEFTPEDG
jgi:outer membrane biosynthesis protein TonB